MFQIIIHITMDRTHIVKELVSSKACSKIFKSTATVYQDILTILKTIFRNRPGFLIECWITFFCPIKPESFNVTDCSYYLHGVCISYIFNRYIADNSHCLPACNSFNFHVQSLQVSQIRQTKTSSEFSIKRMNQIIKNKCESRPESQTKSNLSRL